MEPHPAWPPQPPDLPRLPKGEGVDILAIGAHPDDVELTSAGFLLLAHELGQTTAAIDCTRGEAGTRGTVADRDVELATASRLLGLSDRVNLNLPDGGVENTPEARAQLVREIRRLRPRLAVIPPKDDDDHPDHQAVAHLALEAIHHAAKPRFRPDLGAPHSVTQTVFAIYRQPRLPTFVVDITSVWDRAFEVASVFASQLGTDGKGGRTTFISNENFLHWWRGRRAFLGSQIRARWGEGYAVRLPLRIDDPLGFFRTPPATR